MLTGSRGDGRDENQNAGAQHKAGDPWVYRPAPWGSWPEEVAAAADERWREGGLGGGGC